jgi:S-methylmethionine-dependent homocysteine/selenocysteine methylase
MGFRHALPQLEGGTFLTDGGIETVLIFHRGIELPAFAAFVLLEDEAGTDELRRYFEPYLELARRHGTGFVLDAPTWRANPRWGAEIGRSAAEIDAANRRAITLMAELRDRHAGRAPVVVSGTIGPHDDGYDPAVRLTAEEAEAFHATQIATFADTAADMVTALTLTYADEAIGITRAAAAAGMPAAVSFTVETDGRLPDGTTLAEAVEQVDAETATPPAYYMINCAHPTHFEGALGEGAWRERVRGLRANASTRSHAELDEATELDEGDPADLGARYAALRERLPALTVLGGCCGTDHRHVAAIAEAWTAGAGAAA